MSKSAAAYLLDPLNAPEPSAETGPGSHFGNTFAQAPQTSSPSTPPRTSLSSNNPFRDENSRSSPTGKGGVTSSESPVGQGSPRRPFPEYREAAFGGQDSYKRRSGSSAQGVPPPSYDDVTSASNSPTGKGGHHRRTSSLKERYPGDHSHEPLNIIRRDSRKADRSPHLKKKHQPGADMIDRLDPAVGGRAYHHEGPYDAALLARNSSYESSPIAALKTSNAEALKATPQENIKDAVERHKPLDGVAAVPPGMADRFGRVYNYEEGADLMHEDNADGPGYKRWPEKEYAPNDLKGESEPTFSLDRAFQAHKIDDSGIEMTTQQKGRHDDGALANSTESDIKRTGSLRAAGESLKKRIGSLRHRNADE